jgi:hypothetical protein
MEESQMSMTAKLTLASILALGFAASLQAQSPQQGDYYRFQPWTPQQVSPAQERRIQQGDYYKPVATATAQQNSPRDAAIHKCLNAAHRTFKALSANTERTEYYKSCMATAGYQP